jgi:multiple sugar transport system permease protein
MAQQLDTNQSSTGLGTRQKENLWRGIIFSVLVLLGVVFFVPFYWMIVQATHTSKEILRLPPPLWFGDKSPINYQGLLATIPFWRNYLNSVIISGGTVVITLVICSMSGYAFALLRFPGKNLLFGILLMTMMIPWVVSIIPWYIIMARFGWIDSYQAIILPAGVNGFGVFWMRQYITAHVPSDLLDSARMDGCPEATIFPRVVAPVITPAYGALAILAFVNSWNNFFYPLIILRSKTMFTLPVALDFLNGDPYRGMDFGVTMMGTSLAVLPVMLVFWFASRRFIEGLTAGAVKG